MAEQRQPFRFRLPWLSAANTPRPAAEPQPPRPTVQPQIPSQQPTPAPRPPFRPPGIAPAQLPPSQVQAPPRAEPQAAPLRPAAIESQTTSQPVSPSRATRTASVPPSPTRATNESRVTSQPASPARATTQTRPPSQTQSPSRSTQQSKAASTTPSPSRTASQPSQPKSPSRATLQRVDRAFSQPTSPFRTTTPGEQEPTRTVPQPLSPSKKIESTRQDTSQPQPMSPILPSSASKEERKPESYLPLSQEPEPKTQPTSEAPSKHQIDTPVETILQQEGKAARATEAPSPGTLIAPNSGAAPKQQAIALTKAEEKLEETAERKKSVEKIHDKKKTVTTSPSDGKVIRTVDATQPKARRTHDESIHKRSLSKGERAPLPKEIQEDISKLVQTLATGQSKQSMDEKPISVITLAGENKGASMHIGSQAAKKVASVHIRRGYKTNPDDSPDATNDGEGRREGKHIDPNAKEEMATKAYVNSNVQGINNSIMFVSNVNERNPGVQLAFSHNFAEPSRYSGKPEPLETSKAEYNVTPAEKLTYAPTVRRRCLRGLFLEPSDSEPDNPEKPRRHGCRYDCRAKKRDEDIGIL